MMSGRFSTLGRRLAGLTAAGVIVATSLVVVAGAAPAGPPPLPRYASPSGIGTMCTQAAPCNILTAINAAPFHDEVILDPGHYGSPTSPINDTITDGATGDLFVHGLTGSTPPAIYTAAQTGVEFSERSDLRNVRIYSTGNLDALEDTGYVDHVFVESSAGQAGACEVVHLSDSVCVGTAKGVPGVGYVGSGPAATMVNVTAVALGKHAPGLEALNIGSGSIKATIVNSIIRGQSHDVVCGGGRVSLTFSYSDYRSVKKKGKATVTSSPTDIKAAPKFRNAAKLKFAERSSSPSIDAGTDHPATADPSTTDLVGHPRRLGSATDMGAYEFLPKPRLGRLSIIKRTTDFIRLAVKVNPEDQPTAVIATARHINATRISTPATAGAGVHAKVVRLTIHRLRARTAYDVDVTGTNQTGSTESKRVLVSTR